MSIRSRILKVGAAKSEASSGGMDAVFCGNDRFALAKVWGCGVVR